MMYSDNVTVRLLYMSQSESSEEGPCFSRSVERRGQEEAISSDESGYSNDLAAVDAVDDCERFGTREQRREWGRKEGKRLREVRQKKMISTKNKTMESSPSRVGGNSRRGRREGGAKAARVAKRAAKASEEELKRDIEKPCGCESCNHFETVPFHVLAHMRRQYSEMSLQQRKHSVFYHCLRMYEQARGRREEKLKTGVSRSANTNRVYELNQSKYKELESANIVLKHVISDPHDPEQQYEICQAGLRIITRSFSGNLVTGFMKLIKSGQHEYYHELLDASDFVKGTMTPLVQSVVLYLEEKIADIGQHDPTSSKVILSKGDQTEFFQEYCDLVEAKHFEDLGVVVPASSSYFSRIFRKNYADVVTMPRRPNKFSKCSYCADLKICKSEATGAARTAYSRHYRRHLLWVGQQRAKYRLHRAKAKAQPNV